MKARWPNAARRRKSVHEEYVCWVRWWRARGCRSLSVHRYQDIRIGSSIELVVEVFGGWSPQCSSTASHFLRIGSSKWTAISSIRPHHRYRGCSLTNRFILHSDHRLGHFVSDLADLIVCASLARLQRQGFSFPVLQGATGKSRLPGSTHNTIRRARRDALEVSTAPNLRSYQPASPQIYSMFCRRVCDLRIGEYCYCHQTQIIVCSD